MIFASELAAFVGRNKYEDPAAAAAKIWRRASPATYAAAEARAGVALRTDEEVVEAMGVGIAAAVDAADEQAADAQVAAILEQPLFAECPAALARDLGAAVSASGALADKVSRVMQAVSYAAGGPLTSAATHALRQAATGILHRAMSSAVPPAPAQAEAQALVQVQVQALARSVCVRDRVGAEASVHASVNRARGTAREPEALRLFEHLRGATVRDRNDRFYTANLGSQQEPCWLGGRVDGVCGDRVVEVKCRRNRFFNFLTEYEKVQIHAYMHLTGKPECELVQKFNGQVRSDLHAFDSDFWAGVQAEARLQWARLLRVVEDDRLQDDLLRSCVV
jgi:hypothetical protein